MFKISYFKKAISTLDAICIRVWIGCWYSIVDVAIKSSSLLKCYNAQPLCTRIQAWWLALGTSSSSIASFPRLIYFLSLSSVTIPQARFDPNSSCCCLDVRLVVIVFSFFSLTIPLCSIFVNSQLAHLLNYVVFSTTERWFENALVPTSLLPLGLVKWRTCYTWWGSRITTFFPWRLNLVSKDNYRIICSTCSSVQAQCIGCQTQILQIQFLARAVQFSSVRLACILRTNSNRER